MYKDQHTAKDCTPVKNSLLRTWSSNSPVTNLEQSLTVWVLLSNCFSLSTTCIRRSLVCHQNMLKWHNKSAPGQIHLLEPGSCILLQVSGFKAMPVLINDQSEKCIITDMHFRFHLVWARDPLPTGIQTFCLLFQCFFQHAIVHYRIAGKLSIRGNEPSFSLMNLWTTSDG